MQCQVEAHLSRALAVPVVRRHARGGIDSSDGFHYGPAVRIVSGNFVTGKRRGVVDGVDFGATGSGVMLPVNAHAYSSDSLPRLEGWDLHGMNTPHFCPNRGSPRQLMGYSL